MIDLHTCVAEKAYGTIRKLAGKVWIPVKGFEQHLDAELAFHLNDTAYSIQKLFGTEQGSIAGKNTDPQAAPLVYCEGIRQDVFWKQLCWEAPFIAKFASIGEAANLLRSIQRNWVHYPLQCFRRAELISKKLPYISNKERNFPYAVPLTAMGIWSLLDEHTLLASAQTSSPFPLGLIHFNEDHHNPPSRAYLKLWEALILMDFYYRRAQVDTDAVTTDCGKQCLWGGAKKKSCTPRVHRDMPSSAAAAEVPAALSEPAVSSMPAISKASVVSERALDILLSLRGSTCIDAGASPGGWTWVLRKLGCSVTAIDRSPLADFLMAQPHITFMQHDAFTVTPESLGKKDWVFSDVICYPPRLLAWITKWLESGLCSKFICTIKMQGNPDFETIKRFAHIPHSKIVHLTANKHELTWLCAPFIDSTDG